MSSPAPGCLQRRLLLAAGPECAAGTAVFSAISIMSLRHLARQVGHAQAGAAPGGPGVRLYLATEGHDATQPEPRGTPGVARPNPAASALRHPRCTYRGRGLLAPRRKRLNWEILNPWGVTT